MKIYQQWTGHRIRDGIREEPFPATVPGNIQYDYARAHGFADVMVGEGCRQFEALEDDTWEYCTTLRLEKKEGEKLYFVSHGIDYLCDILLNGKLLLSHEGVFSPIEVDLTEYLTGEDRLCVRIHPHPKRAGAPRDRCEADHSCKPPVCYGWDWNPRLLISGMWQEAYLETRDPYHIGRCEVRYFLNEDLTGAEVSVRLGCALPCTVTLWDAEGNTVYSGTQMHFSVEHPHLWWCHGQGEPYLYTWRVENAHASRTGTLGFRRVRLLRNKGANDPKTFPKSRYAPPFTLELNGRRIFMKGTNWVNPDIFWAHITPARCEELILLARDANMNIFRMWGGAGPCIPAFYDLCDKYGMLVWQEFMLGCNDYPDDAHYLAVLEQEAASIIRSLRSHPCLAFWCGGNELFNGWSGMTDQSHALRLLGSLCYTLDREHPFLMTSPLTEMGHGGYMFYDPSPEMGGDVMQVFGRSSHIAYTEFGVPSMASMEILENIIPKEERFPVRATPSWLLHHGLRAWKPQSHVCPEVLSHYWGEPRSLEEMVEHSQWLQCIGYQTAFEEMRRQWPHCSAALNWCFNEPWYTAANCSILSYPAQPKPAYYAVRDALRPTLFSARIPKFDWRAGERFTAAIWLLNDGNTAAAADVRVVLELGEQRIPLLTWEGATAEARTNTEGAQICCILPDVETDRMTLRLESDGGYASSYRLLYRPLRKKAAPQVRRMNQ